MKKALIKLFCLCLALVFAFSLVACDENTDTESKTESVAQSDPAIVGVWNGTIDQTDAYNKGMEDNGVGEYIKVSAYKVIATWTFNADGSYSVAMDKEATAEGMKAPREEFVTGMKAYVEDLMEAEATTMTFDEYCTANEIDIEATADANFGEAALTELSAELSESGKYEAKDGKIFVWTANGEKNENNYFSYTFSGDFTLTGRSDGEAAENFPIVLKKK